MNIVDVLFIVDVTDSMDRFVEDAKRRMQSILTELSDKYGVDLKAGLSLYRDHPSQDHTFVTVTFDLKDAADIAKVIGEIQVDGGGDTPEAVIDGIIDGMNAMSWRDNSRRIAFLIGDAPAHGMIDDENCCQCGQTWGKAVVSAQRKNVVVYAILLSSDIMARSNFRTIANFTGGMLIENNNAMDVILETLRTELDNMNLDSRVLDMLSKDCSVDDICGMLNINREEFATAKSRIAQFSA